MKREDDASLFVVDEGDFAIVEEFIANFDKGAFVLTVNAAPVTRSAASISRIRLFRVVRVVDILLRMMGRSPLSRCEK